MKLPFKFLDSYGLEDRDIFFGRDAEIKQLYTLIFQTRLLLVYGQSGTGKTSLIQCGLANRFDPLDWFPIFVRRKDDINAALALELRRAAVTPIADHVDVTGAIDSLYLDHLRPIYIIFDQFEELFVLGTAEEQARFVATVKTILTADIRCKIIISMREEYLAALDEFERAVPSLFDTRLRIEQMTSSTIEQVILDMTAAAGITLENGRDTAKRIFDNISDKRRGVQLSYLQVYLDKLYRSAATGAAPLVFTDALVTKTGKLDDVLADFVEEQTAIIQKGIALRHPGVDKDAVQRVLEEMTTLEGTKQPMPRAELAVRLPRLVSVLDETLDGLERSRILRCADGIWELAHDSLAGRIADRRGSERKALMRVEKLIRDRLAAFDQARTYLTPEELAVVRPVLGQLSLAPAESDFVKSSSDKARRRRMLIIGGTISIIAVLAAFGGFAFEGRQRATRALELASDTTNDLSFTIFDNLQSIDGTQDIRLRLLDKVGKVDAELLRGGGPDNSNAPFWRKVLQGDIALEAWENNQSETHLKTAENQFRAALAEAKQVGARYPADASWRRNESVAVGRLGRSLTFAGRPEDALRQLVKAVAIDEALLKADPQAFQTNFDLAMSLGDLAEVERGTDAQAAAGHYTRSIALLRRLAAQYPGNRDVRYNLATRAMRLGGLELERDGLGVAEALYREAAEALVWLGQQDRSNLEWRADLAAAWEGLARANLFMDEFGAARIASDKALLVADDLVAIDKDDSDPLRVQRQSELRWQRAEIERQAGDMRAAARWATLSFDSAMVLQRIDPDNIAWQETLAASYRQLADVEQGRCKFDAARAASEESLKIARELARRDDDNLDLMASLYVTQERRAEIESHDRSFKAAAAATGEALRIAMELRKDRPQDRQLAEDIRRLESTKRNLDARIPLPLPRGCLPGTPG